MVVHVLYGFSNHSSFNSSSSEARVYDVVTYMASSVPGGMQKKISKYTQPFYETRHTALRSTAMELPYAYMYFVRHIIPGPQSLSYLVPHILLPIALLTPRSVLSRWQNIAVFFPIMVGCTIHAWTVMGGVDVPSLNGLFWSFFLLVLKDPWTKFALLKPDVETNGMTVNEDHARPDDHAKAIQYPNGTTVVDNHTKQDGHAKSIQHQNTKPSYTAVPYPPTLQSRIPWTFKLISV